MNIIIRYLVIYIISCCLILCFDFVWFTTYSFKHLYKPMFLSINNTSNFFYRKTAAVFSYLFLGIILTTLWGKFSDQTHFYLTGAIAGLFIYGTYNLTNLATIKNYTVLTTIIDTLWGTLLFGLICLILPYIPLKTK